MESLPIFAQPTLEQLLEQTVSHVWFGDNSALYLELGQLTERLRKDGTLGNPEGQFTVYASFDWRVENARSILGGSTCSPTQRTSLAQRLLGSTVTSVGLFGRIPELQLGFGNGIWLTTFDRSKGQPGWCVSFHQRPATHLCVRRGKLAVDRGD